MAQAVGAVTPAAGTIGTELVITGSGFGESKGRVVLIDPEKAKDPPLAIQSWSDTTIEARIKRAPDAGATTLQVQTADGATADAAFTVLAPTLVSLSQTVGLPKQAVVATIDDLGTGRPRIDLGFRRARVTKNQAQEGDRRLVTFRLARSRRQPAGTWNVQVTNRVGEDVLPTVFQVTSSKARRISGRRIRGTVDDVEIRVSAGRTRSKKAEGAILVTGSGRRPDTKARFELELLVPTPGAVPATFTGAPGDAASLVYREIVDGVTTEWTSAGGALSVTVQGLLQRQLGGILTATVTADGQPARVLELSFVAKRV